MKMSIRTCTIALACVLGLSAVSSAQGQSTARAGAGRWETSAFPGGAVWSTEGDTANAPDFVVYAFGGSATFNVNRRIGVEGEVVGGISVDQDLAFGSSIQRDAKVPHSLAYTGNIVFSPLGSDRVVVPYITGGAGGLTLFSREAVTQLGLTQDETFFTGNAGGGVKWFLSRHVGLRADYRFIAVASRDDAPAFFGRDEARFGHRIYGGIVLTGAR